MSTAKPIQDVDGAKQYLLRHNLHLLFEDLAADVITDRPADPLKYIHDRVGRMMQAADKQDKHEDKQDTPRGEEKSRADDAAPAPAAPTDKDTYPDGEPFRTGSLEVRVAELRHMPDPQVAGELAPYCVVAVGSSTARTAVAADATAPAWDAAVSIPVADTKADTLTVQLFNDASAGDEAMGTAAVALDRVTASEQWSERWVTLAGTDVRVVARLLLRAAPEVEAVAPNKDAEDEL